MVRTSMSVPKSFVQCQNWTNINAEYFLARATMLDEDVRCPRGGGVSPPGTSERDKELSGVLAAQRPSQNDVHLWNVSKLDSTPGVGGTKDWRSSVVETYGAHWG
jgi:hypothetical protein